MSWLLYPWEKSPYYRVGPTAGLDELDMRKNRFPLPGIEPQFPGYPAHSLVTKPTTLLWLSLTLCSILNVRHKSHIHTKQKLQSLQLQITIFKFMFLNIRQEHKILYSEVN
jgi:hypothetical protein